MYIYAYNTKKMLVEPGTVQMLTHRWGMKWASWEPVMRKWVGFFVVVVFWKSVKPIWESKGRNERYVGMIAREQRLRGMERRAGAVKLLSLSSTSIPKHCSMDYFSIGLTRCMSGSYIHSPAEATKGKEGMWMLFPPVPCHGERGSAAQLCRFVTNPTNFISDYLCFLVSGH